MSGSGACGKVSGADWWGKETLLIQKSLVRFLSETPIIFSSSHSRGI